MDRTIQGRNLREMTPEKQDKAAWHELEKLLKEDALKEKN